MTAHRRMRVAGLMSGTSADGITAAIVDIGGRKASLRAWGTVPYAPEIRAEVLRLSEPGKAGVQDVCRMNFALGELFAAALIRVAKRAHIALASIDLIGSHGQTICHLPVGTGSTSPQEGGQAPFCAGDWLGFASSQNRACPLSWRKMEPVPAEKSCLSRHAVRSAAAYSGASTLQIAEPSVIAERTGITTVSDFRPRDVAAGGQGAPLVPFADHFLFSHPRRNRCLQNIGGIANVTFLRAGGALDDVVAFDTGPGNMMMDAVTSIITRGRRNYDAGGRLAAKGRVDNALLAKLMRHPYLRRKPPKTTGREDFGRAFAEVIYVRAKGGGRGDRREKGDRRQKGDRHLNALRVPVTFLPPVTRDLDILATVTAFTAYSIADAYRRFLPSRIDEVILCGGGSHNATLVRMLRAALPQTKLAAMNDYGIHPDAKEAVSFAILARETILGRPSNVPSATGASKPVILGKIVPA